MASFKTSLLYVVSGTGNTYRVACWIQDSLEQRGIETRLKFIEDENFQDDLRYSNDQLTAVLFPTHGFMPPWSMIKFLFRLPRQKKVPVMSIATRGAIWIGPIKIPGAAGFANFFAALILLCKGYDIRGFFSLDMAANMNNLHPSLSLKSIEALSIKTQDRLASFLDPILLKKRVLFTLNNLYEAIVATFLFWLIPIFPILYLIYAKTSMAKIMFANNRCVSCGICAKICPSHAIEMKKFWGSVRPFWTYHCENCMRCMGFCPKKAVEAGHSWAILQIFLLSIPLLIMKMVGISISQHYFFKDANYWLTLLLESLYYLPALFLSYWIFWMLIRIPLVNTFFSLTTLTHYFKRYHEPKTRIKDLFNNPKE